MIIPNDQVEVYLKKGSIVQSDGWFMNDARYQRYRRAVADKILEAQPK